ncbi:zinc finger domain-containing protein [Rhodococcus sp. OK302]
MSGVGGCLVTVSEHRPVPDRRYTSSGPRGSHFCPRCQRRR